MTRVLPRLLMIAPLHLVWLAACPPAVAQEDASLEENTCYLCHTNTDLWDEDTLHLLVPLEVLERDHHWQLGIRCQDCHGGDPESFQPREAHAEESGFRAFRSPADVPDFCGHCHSDPERLKTYQAEGDTDLPDTGLVARFWSSVHGQQLKNSDAARAVAAGDEPAEPAADEEAVDAETADAEPAEAAEAEPVGQEAAPAPDRQAVTCTSCHGGHGMPPRSNPLSQTHPSQLSNTCATCHPGQLEALAGDVHRQAGPPGEAGTGSVLSCLECHAPGPGEQDVHGMLPVQDRGSGVFLNHQIENCGQCHEPDKQTYLESVHGRGLTESGLLVTASCSDCHGAHGVLPAEDPLSQLHPTRVADTCAKCHRFIQERLNASVHGGIVGPGGALDHAAPGGQITRTPSCTDCHQGHDLADPRAAPSRIAMTHRCGDCHAELLHQYALSVHGALTELGYGPAAKCADCHGHHDIRPVADPQSRVNPVNRAETCGRCHPGASGNFLNFDPHADHTDPERSPVLYAVYMVLLSFILGTFGFFGLHSILWFLRSLVDVTRHGREHSWTPGAAAYVRFNSFHRLAHTVLLVSFLGLALTGLPLKYSHTEWARTVAVLMGGFASTSVWHRIFGVVNLGCLAVYLVRMMVRVIRARRRGASLKQALFNPDSPLPTWRDVRDFMAMIRWFFFQGKKPTFERWAYWEKFDFWGASADTVIIGFTGLILWFPHAFTAFLPGETLNIAKVIHSTQALLATAFVFAIHFFATHLRPEKFPMDMVMLTGMVSEHELREERPEMLERLEREGKLEALRTTIPSRRRLITLAFGGTIGLTIGLALLAGILIGIFGG